MEPPAPVVPAPLTPQPRARDTWEMVIPKTTRPSARREPSPIVPAPAGPTNPEFLPTLEFPNKLGSSPLGLRVALYFLPVLAIAGALYFTSTRSAAPTAPVAAADNKVEVGPRLSVGFGGWIPEFVPTWGDKTRPRVTLLRGSEKLTDFRLEFPGQIGSNALGWIFRAKDSRNFYVMKLELGEPSGILTRFAVINGKEQPRVQIPLPMALRLGPVYNVRQDVRGNTFITSIQGQKVDQWVDRQIPDGGVGLYSEAGERSNLKGPMALFELRSKSQARK